MYRKTPRNLALNSHPAATSLKAANTGSEKMLPYNENRVYWTGKVRHLNTSKWPLVKVADVPEESDTIWAERVYEDEPDELVIEDFKRFGEYSQEHYQITE
jgi:hypothetical protein